MMGGAMLELIRRYKGLFSIVFVISAIGMVVSMTGTPGMGGPLGGGLMGSDVVARVEGEEIPTRELMTLLNREYERMESLMQQQGAQNAEQAQMIRQIMMSQLNPQQLLQRLVYQRFVYSTALKVGIRSAPEAITELIRAYPDFQKNGRFDPILYRQLVARPALFEEDLRKQVAMTTLQRSFENGLHVVSKGEVENQRWLDRKIVFETVEVSPASFADVRDPAAADLEAFSKEADAEARLQAYYNRNISEFKKDEEIRVRHILVREGSEKNIQKIAQEIREGKLPFDEAAKQYSEDPSNAGQGGDLGYFGKGMMVPEFEKVAFSLKTPNQISEPVKTQFGEHLIQFIDRREASARSLDEVRSEILPAVWKEREIQVRLDALLKDWASKPQGPTARDLAAHKLKWEKLEPWTPRDPFIPALGNVDPHLEVLLRLSKERPFLGQPISRGDTQLLVRFVSEEWPKPEGDAKPGSEEIAAAESKVAQAYEHFFRMRYEEAEKKKRIVISQERVAEIQRTLQAQQNL
jgi:parvulin-like peptidyl-prolyl isomerase